MLGAARLQTHQGIMDRGYILFNAPARCAKSAGKVGSDLGRIATSKKRRCSLAWAAALAGKEVKRSSKRAPFVDVVFGPQALHRLPRLLNARKAPAKPQVDIQLS